MDDDDILIEVWPSAGRRWMGIIMLAVLGAVLLAVAASGGPEPFWIVFVLVIALTCLWGAYSLWSATATPLLLSREALVTGTGETVLNVSDVLSVERGPFAFKPSNGFVVRLNTSMPRRWMPGLFWRVGRRVGVGGTLSGGRTRAMAEVLTALQQGIFPGRDEGL